MRRGLGDGFPSFLYGEFLEERRKIIILEENV
jgi:hypothetical protein